MKIKIGEIEFQNPFILASGPATRTAEMIARAFKLGWAGAVTKTICLNYEMMVDVSPRIAKINGGLKNIELISSRSPENWVEDIRFLKNSYPKSIVIASISAEVNNPGAWQELTLMMQDAGADILELNFSCPHGLPELDMGNTCSDTPYLAGEIINSIKKVSKIPVWAKLSPNVSSIKHLAGVCVKNKADGITAINTVKGFAGVDIETGMPELNVEGLTAYGGISGNIIKPVALKAVSEIAVSVDCPVSAAGGIKNWQDAVEFIMLGASTVQICTEVMHNGYEIINGLQKGIYTFLKKHELNSLTEIKGKSLKYIKPIADLNKQAVAAAVIDHSKCIKCGKCYKACFDAGYQAITDSKNGFLKIDRQKCTGCGLCKAICPVKCIAMKVQDSVVPNLQL